MRNKVFLVVGAVLVAGFFFNGLQNADAAILDLLTAGSDGYINGAYYLQTDLNRHATGTGIIESFVRIQRNGTEQGYNTDGRPVPFDENNSAQFTHSLLLSDVPITTINNIAYREFLLDINEASSSPQHPTEGYISLDQLQIYLGTAGNFITTNIPSLGTLVYNLDGSPDGNSTINLNYDLNPGSGKGDMFAYIPNSYFTGSNQYVYLYSQFGSSYDTSDGFEEWAVKSVIPEPATLSLLGLGLLGLAGLRKKKIA